MVLYARKQNFSTKNYVAIAAQNFNSHGTVHTDKSTKYIFKKLWAFCIGSAAGNRK
jgi:hypothetical protein